MQVLFRLKRNLNVALSGEERRPFPGEIRQEPAGGHDVERGPERAIPLAGGASAADQVDPGQSLNDHPPLSAHSLSRRSNLSERGHDEIDRNVSRGDSLIPWQTKVPYKYRNLCKINSANSAEHKLKSHFFALAMLLRREREWADKGGWSLRDWPGST